jgi:hypothetical protein
LGSFMEFAMFETSNSKFYRALVDISQICVKTVIKLRTYTFGYRLTPVP